MIARGMGLEAGAVFVNHCAALMIASPLQGTVSGRLGKDYRVAGTAVDFLDVR